MELLFILAIFALVFFLFTAAQLIGFVFKVIGLALTGLFALMGWILAGSWVIAKTFLVLVLLIMFGVHLIGLGAFVLMLVLLVGVARLAFDRRRRPAATACIYEDDLISRLRRDIDRMRARMENLETILDRR